MGSVLKRETFPMTAIAPLLGKLGVITAYLAFAFVGAIVLGLF